MLRWHNAVRALRAYLHVYLVLQVQVQGRGRSMVLMDLVKDGEILSNIKIILSQDAARDPRWGILTLLYMPLLQSCRKVEKQKKER
ncbi:hypothetical protein BDW68DRAFT_133003 [Aspergillus falconensis]